MPPDGAHFLIGLLHCIERWYKHSYVLCLEWELLDDQINFAAFLEVFFHKFHHCSFPRAFCHFILWVKGLEGTVEVFKLLENFCLCEFLHFLTPLLYWRAKSLVLCFSFDNFTPTSGKLLKCFLLWQEEMVPGQGCFADFADFFALDIQSKQFFFSWSICWTLLAFAKLLMAWIVLHKSRIKLLLPFILWMPLSLCLLKTGEHCFRALLAQNG